ncbi:hypothetical protein [Acinetobacter sp. ULE_I037]|uniref:hypothetical protein n=1 Tax=unclassified Acinetobacter TaxID=196816 RepID=UPI003AF4D673
MTNNDQNLKAESKNEGRKIYQLNKVLDERTKEWLEAIECGTYFQDVAKLLKTENEEKDRRIKQALMMIDHIQKVGLISSSYGVEDVQKVLRGKNELKN